MGQYCLTPYITSIMNLHQESNRINNLRSFKILDTIGERDYDELTKLASYICQTPISLVSLIDTNRLWFKSHLGLDVSQIPRAEYSFCCHAIEHQDEVMIVHDARKDPRFKENPLVLGHPHIVFYAGVPLISPEGHALGTLCVIDKEERSFTEQQKEALEALGNQVTNLLVLRRQGQELKAELDKNEFMTKEIHHRVINNLQLLLDLLYLQSKNYPELKAEFGHFSDRIKAIASIHKTLFDSSNDKVSLGSYLNELSKSIIEGLTEGHYLIDFNFQADDIFVDSKKVLTFGILLNELMTNSIKYAFENISHKKISVALLADENGIVELKYEDNGRGMDMNPAANDKNIGFGRQLVNQLAAELNGSVELKSSAGKGTLYRIRSFPALGIS